ncbi:juvenile hormone esterase-like [Phymastichus coffea]|uniref:juvenile hormone esterase-like n=1 Tax=Phymastichus coffea TaxID=108790 RepID=UPI00273BCF1B|nr:juvenile hormone esterase-like [Phymastichus coffea]
MERKNAVVDTSSGKLQGSCQRSCLGDKYYAFKGIPYAKPPTGQLRFRDPQPMEPWTDIRNAMSYGSISAQYDAGLKEVIGSEDCLYLNVYTRNLDACSRAPVMFWIHGGAFLSGSGNDDMFGPDYLLTKSVVLVTINYRLGVFGFFDLEDKVAPGNQGLKDQVMALKWVRNNIINFGGDPDNVTIFGGSAGAASVHFLTMSPMAKGLFHKAICQSGTAISTWATKKNPKKVAFQFLDALNCKQQDPKVIVEFLRNIEYTRIIEAQQTLATPLHMLRGDFPFTPGIDDQSDEPFLNVPAAVAAEEGVQVPLMIGSNTLEGLVLLRAIRALDLIDINRNLEHYMFSNIEKILQRYNLTLKDLRQLYLKNDLISNETLHKYLELLGDILVTENIHRLAKIQFHNGAAPTYLYKLSYEKNLSLSKKQLNTDIKGANHGDELMYLFRAHICDTLNLVQLQEGTGADRVMKQMVELWTNFAKTGRPTSVASDLLPLYWQPVGSDVILRYLNIGEELRMEKELNIEQRYSYKRNDFIIH